jgi:hypothetical protein
MLKKIKAIRKGKQIFHKEIEKIEPELEFLKNLLEYCKSQHDYLGWIRIRRKIGERIRMLEGKESA